MKAAIAIALFIGMPWPTLAAEVEQGEAPPGWSALAQQGRDLYFGTRRFAQAAQVAQAPLPAADAACVRCHGALGEGTREAATASADLRWPALRERGAVDAGSVLRAATHGVGLRGRPLGAAMPRYAFTPQEQAALTAFWPWLGEDAQPVRGVHAAELRLGFNLDGLSSAPARSDVVAGMRAVLQEVNERGGLHGRQVRLEPSSAAGSGDVFALLGSALPAPEQAGLRELRLPSLAAVGLDREDARADQWQVPLLPSLRQQARQALQLLDTAPEGCTRWLADPQGLAGHEATGATGRIARGASPPALPAGATLCVAALMPAAEVDRLRAQWKAGGTQLAMLVELAWLRTQPLAEQGLAHRLVLPMPSAIADEAARQGRSVWFVLGQAAARAGSEALARSGRVLQPELALERFRGLGGFEPVAGAPLSLGRAQVQGWAPERFDPGPSLIQTARESPL